MSKARVDNHFVLAVCIAVAAVVAITMNAVEIISTYELDTASVLAIISGVVSQASFALAMLCVIIIGRQVVATGSWRPPAAVSEPAEPAILEPGDDDED